MASPAKKRKLNGDSKSSPAAPRNLDYFFGKQRQNVPSRPANNTDQKPSDPVDPSTLTDEELARKLQAEWDQEAAGGSSADQESKDPGVGEGLDSKIVPAKVETAPAGETAADGTGGETNGSKGSANVKPELGTKSKNILSLQATGSAEDTITSNIPFDESPLTFEPARYIEDLQGHWAAEGGNASYALLTRCFVLVNSTQSRIKIVDTLVNLLRVIIEGDPSSLLPTVRSKYYSLYSMFQRLVPHIWQYTLKLNCLNNY
jgi:DNA ligase 1